jgi:hypothetical protein
MHLAIVTARMSLEREHLDFLYANTGAGDTITLRPGVAFCFRKFHPLISDLVRGAWGRLVRQQNLEVLGETADLNEFLFGSVEIPIGILDQSRRRIFTVRAIGCVGVSRVILDFG